MNKNNIVLIFIASLIIVSCSKVPEGMIFVKGGTFQMGDEVGDLSKGCRPVHNVTVRDFYIGKTEVTQSQYKVVMGETPSNSKGDNLPVDQVSWNDAVVYCNKLSDKEGLEKCYSGNGDSIRCNFSTNGYRLPTEAEWEYASRGGSLSSRFKYSGSNNIDDVAWYSVTTNDKGTKPVGTKQANELGIFDMSGNVREWCNDWAKRHYHKGIVDNPIGASKGWRRIYRGGSWHNRARHCRVAYRWCGYPFVNDCLIGFRVLRLP